MSEDDEPFCEEDLPRFASLGKNEAGIIELLLQRGRPCYGAEVRKELHLSPSNASSSYGRLLWRGLIVLDHYGPPFSVVLRLTQRTIDYYNYKRG